MAAPLGTLFTSSLLALCAAAAQAADSPTVTISGFGTAALTATDTDDAEFARPNQIIGAGKDARTGVDSNFGIQATAKLNDTFSLTGQGMVRQFGRAHYGAALTLAFAKMKVHDDVSVRVGRLGLPIYMVSDFRSVGYANTMLRPSTEVYGQAGSDVFDGADMIYEHSFGDTTLTAQLGYGNSTTHNGDSRLVLKRLMQLNVVAVNGPFTFRLGHNRTRISLEGVPVLDDLLVTLREVGLGNVADDLDMSDVPGTFNSLGMVVDYKNFLLQTEIAQRKAKSRLLIESTTSYYVMLGYRFGKVTPFYNYGLGRQDGEKDYAGVPTEGPLAGLGAFVNAVVKAPEQTSHAVGLRWDFHKSAALKLQVDRITPKNGAGFFINAKPGFTGPVTVYGAGIDFVF